MKEDEELVKEKETEEVSKRHKKKFEKYENEIQVLKTQVDYWKNEYYRAYADTKNLRNSLEKDKAKKSSPCCARPKSSYVFAALYCV